MNEDLTSWDDLIKSVQPLTKRQLNKVKKPLAPRLKVRRKITPEPSYALDLHGLTLEQAYNQLKTFIIRHQTLGSLKVTVVTGKGLTHTGAIKKEIELWLDTSFFKDKIRTYVWKNDGGALDITLKRIKKCQNK